MKYEKQPVKMLQFSHRDGYVEPLEMTWVDEAGNISKHPIDRVESHRDTYVPHVGGLATKYIVMINGRLKTLWYDRPKSTWFVEKMVNDIK